MAAVDPDFAAVSADEYRVAAGAVVAPIGAALSCVLFLCLRRSRRKGMGTLLRVVWQIVLLRQGPQALPASTFLLWLVLGAHWLTGVVLGLYGLPLPASMLAAFIGTLVMSALVYTLLSLHRRTQRLTQTLTALAACEILLGVISLPLTALFFVGAGMLDIAVMLWLLIMGWGVAVTAHIFRHALDVTMGAGILFAIAYTLISISLGGLVGTPEG